MAVDSEQLRVLYEGAVKNNPSNIEAVHYLAVWHLERHSFQQARKYFAHLTTLRTNDSDVWLCLCVCCAMAEEFEECATALKAAKELVDKSDEDVRIKFCHALMSEKRKDYTTAMEGYVMCLNQCANIVNGGSAVTYGLPEADKQLRISFMKELRGEVMLRIAVLKKEMGAIDQALQMCNTITNEPFSDSIKANALCLKGLLHEMRTEFPASEVVYRSVLQITTGHSTALERLGRVYLRYRETIPAAVQCFFKSVETNPSNHVAWYLLGRCYMATSQYSDACEAYNRAVNLNPNDAQVWCSLGVLYYAFGQYREALGMLARALKLDSTMADAWYNVGALYDMCDQPEDAQQAYLKAKENGLADRFARAGMGLNPLAMQSLQYVNSSSSHNASSSSNSQTNASNQAAQVQAAAAAAAAASQRQLAAQQQQLQQQLQHQQLQQQQQQLMQQQQQLHQHQQHQQQFGGPSMSAQQQMQMQMQQQQHLQMQHQLQQSQQAQHLHAQQQQHQQAQHQHMLAAQQQAAQQQYLDRQQHQQQQQQQQQQNSLSGIMDGDDLHDSAGQDLLNMMNQHPGQQQQQQQRMGHSMSQQQIQMHQQQMSGYSNPMLHSVSSSNAINEANRQHSLQQPPPRREDILDDASDEDDDLLGGESEDEDM